jgi:Do/DeqQ family serine protease
MRLARFSLPFLVLLAACSDPTSRTSAQALPAAPLAPPNREVPRDAANMRLSFAPIVKRAAPAVVNVYAQHRVRQQIDPFWELFGGAGIPRERVAQSLGSGVNVREDGLIVTNNHVIEGGEQIRVALADRREFPAKVLLADQRADLAVLKIDVGSERLPVLPLAAHDDAQVGDLVLAIGDPFGVGQTVTNGIVSALARTDVGASDFSFFIQTDAPINPGNSGGPLVDMAGNVIGINTLIYSRTGTTAGIGFAIPAAMVRRVVETAVGGGRTVARPWLGARTQTVDADVAKSLGMDRPQGVLVAGVYPESPAARAGLHAGDVILSLDGQAVNDDAGLNYMVATHRPGDQLTLSVRGRGAPRNLAVRLQSPPATPAKDERTLAGQEPLAGATVINLSPASAEELGIDPFLSGVLVTKADGVSAQAGFRPGDLIKSVNGRTVGSTRDLASAVANAGRWRITLERDGQEVTAEF